MRLVTNPGTNVSPRELAEYEVEILPQHIVVDEEHHDTRAGVSFETIDGWIAGARVHPYVLGTSAASAAGLLSKLGSQDPELLLIMSSRKIIQSFDSCTTASNTLENHPKWGHLKIRVVDTALTDIATGMATSYAGMAIAAGFGLEDVARLVEEFCAATVMGFVVQDMTNLVKGGRASFLKAWAAKFLKVRPIIAFIDGTIEPVGRFKTSSDPTDALRDWVLTAREGAVGDRVWLGVSHGNVAAQAEALADKLSETLHVRRRTVLPLTPSIYLHGGPGCIVVAATDLDRLSWVPATERAGTGR